MKLIDKYIKRHIPNFDVSNEPSFQAIYKRIRMLVFLVKNRKAIKASEHIVKMTKDYMTIYGNDASHIAEFVSSYNNTPTANTQMSIASIQH